MLRYILICKGRRIGYLRTAAVRSCSSNQRTGSKENDPLPTRKNVVATRQTWERESGALMTSWARAKVELSRPIIFDEQELHVRWLRSLEKMMEDFQDCAGRRHSYCLFSTCCIRNFIPRDGWLENADIVRRQASTVVIQTSHNLHNLNIRTFQYGCWHPRSKFIQFISTIPTPTGMVYITCLQLATTPHKPVS